MTLIPNVPFAAGDDYTPELAYLAFNQVFDDQTQYLGHRPRIADADLSNVAGQVKPRLAAIEDALKVSVVSGRTLAYSSGSVVLPSGETTSIAAGQIVAPDNATSWVYIDPTGTVKVGDPSVVRVLLAKVTTVSGSVTSLSDRRSVAQKAIMPVAASIKSFGGSSVTDKTATANEVYDQGYYYFRDFTVPAGITITIDKSARIYCSGDVNIAGTVNVTAAGYGAPGQPYGAPSTGSVGRLTGTGLGNRGGTYPWGTQPVGSGGSQGELTTPSGTVWCFTWQGGDGGGGLWIEAAGVITVTGTINAKGTSGGRGGTKPGGNQGETLAGAYALISGSGGGSGGLVLLSSLNSVTVSATATIDVRGGDGGQGLVYVASGTYVSLGGGGGGGGCVVLMSPNNTTTGANILLNGGTTGTPQGATNVSTDVWQATSPSIYLGGGIGAGFGGAGGIYTVSISGSTHTFTRTNGSTGKLIVRNFTPIGS